MDLALKWLHVSGNIFWIGSILAVGIAILSTPLDPKVRGEIALGIYKKLAVPAFVVSFLCGAIRLGMEPHYYMVEHHWMHAKLPLALAVIALHHVIGARARKLALGTVQEAGPTAILSIVLALSAAGAAFFAVVRLPN